MQLWRFQSRVLPTPCRCWSSCPGLQRCNVDFFFFFWFIRVVCLSSESGEITTGHASRCVVITTASLDLDVSISRFAAGPNSKCQKSSCIKKNYLVKQNICQHNQPVLGRDDQRFREVPVKFGSGRMWLLQVVESSNLWFGSCWLIVTLAQLRVNSFSWCVYI